MEKTSDFWEKAPHSLLKTHLQELLSDFDNYLTLAGYSISTRRLYKDFVSGAIRKVDIRNDLAYREYIQQFANSTTHTRISARNVFMMFLRRAADNGKPEKLEQHTGPRMSAAERRAEIYKRKQMIFERAAVDVLQGIEEGFLTDSMEKMLGTAAHMLHIRKKYNGGPSAVDMDTGKAIIKRPGYKTVDNDVDFDITGHITEHPEVDPVTNFKIRKLAENMGLSVEDLEDLRRTDPGTFDTLCEKFLNSTSE